MKEEQHIQDIFKTIRELPPEVDLAGIEQFVLAQPAVVFQPPATDGGGSSLLTIKNFVVMISSISIIGSVALFIGGGNDKPSAVATSPASIQRPLYEEVTPPAVEPFVTDSGPAKPGTPKINPATVYLFNPSMTDSAPPMNEIMIGPGALTANMPFVLVTTPRNTAPVIIQTGKSECDDENHVVSTFVKELEKDGLLNPQKYDIVFRKDVLVVCRKKVSDELYPKYERIYEKLTGKKLKEGTNFMVSYSKGSCSISISENDDADPEDAMAPQDPVSPGEPVPAVGVTGRSRTAVAVPVNVAVEEFSQVEVRGSAHVKIKAGSNFNINVYGREGGSNMNTVVKDSRLIVSQPSTEGEVEVTMPADRLKSIIVSGSGLAKLADRFTGVSKLDVGGSGDIIVEKGIETSDLTITVMGSGTVTASGLQGKKIQGIVLGSGDIIASGTSESVSTNISGSGDINMRNLSTGNAECEILGSGAVRIDVRTSLKAHISGSGDVLYTGNPTVEKKISGSGNVVKQ